MRLPSSMEPPREWWTSGGVDGRRGGGLRTVRAAGGERPALRLLARHAAPELSHLEARPLLQNGRHHHGIEQDVDREEALVRAEALRLADEFLGRVGLG